LNFQCELPNSVTDAIFSRVPCVPLPVPLRPSSSLAFVPNVNQRTFMWAADIPECSQNNGGCDQTCSEAPGTFKCTCDAGYHLVGDYACAGTHPYSTAQHQHHTQYSAVQHRTDLHIRSTQLTPAQRSTLLEPNVLFKLLIICVLSCMPQMSTSVWRRATTAAVSKSALTQWGATDASAARATVYRAMDTRARTMTSAVSIAVDASSCVLTQPVGTTAIVNRDTSCLTGKLVPTSTSATIPLGQFDLAVGYDHKLQVVIQRLKIESLVCS